EDGIRDFHVTGVQTCALPISRTPSMSKITAGTSVTSVCGSHPIITQTSDRRRRAPGAQARPEAHLGLFRLGAFDEVDQDPDAGPGHLFDGLGHGGERRA